MRLGFNESRAICRSMDRDRERLLTGERERDRERERERDRDRFRLVPIETFSIIVHNEASFGIREIRLGGILYDLGYLYVILMIGPLRESNP